MPWGSFRPPIRSSSLPCSRSTTPTLPLPSSATNSRCRPRSTARWSIRPSALPSGILRSSTSASVGLAAVATGPGSAIARRTERAPRVGIKMSSCLPCAADCERRGALPLLAEGVDHLPAVLLLVDVGHLLPFPGKERLGAGPRDQSLAVDHDAAGILVHVDDETGELLPAGAAPASYWS